MEHSHLQRSTTQVFIVGRRFFQSAAESHDAVSFWVTNPIRKKSRRRGVVPAHTPLLACFYDGNVSDNHPIVRLDFLSSTATPNYYRIVS
jgi:hypothetical protein